MSRCNVSASFPALRLIALLVAIAFGPMEELGIAQQPAASSSQQSTQRGSASVPPTSKDGTSKDGAKGSQSTPQVSRSVQALRSSPTRQNIAGGPKTATGQTTEPRRAGTARTQLGSTSRPTQPAILQPLAPLPNPNNKPPPPLPGAKQVLPKVPDLTRRDDPKGELELARELYRTEQVEAARAQLKAIIANYPGTSAQREAEALLRRW